MNSRERILAALNHQETDRIPFDLGSTQVTGIHVIAYRRLRAALGMAAVEPQLCDSIQQLALPDDDLIERLGIDVRGLFPLNSHNWEPSRRDWQPSTDGALSRTSGSILGTDIGDAWEYVDEWGITHKRFKPDGLYYSVIHSPLAGPSITAADVRRYRFPDTGDRVRISGLREQAETYRRQGKAVMLKGVLAGILEMSQRIRGMADFLMDMAADEQLAGALLDKMLELKLAFWEMALPELAGVVDIVSEADDYGTQESQLISPRMFRRMIKPRLAILFQRIKQLAPNTKLFFHSCGNVRPLLPDFIEVGVDILNPVHIRAAGMEPVALKRDFGKDLVFWGGGVDTQGVLPSGTLQQVKADVWRNIDALAPGGGFVFNTVHNIQADVPPENIIAMWEALRES